MTSGAFFMCWGLLLSRASASGTHCHGSEQCLGDAISAVQTQLQHESAKVPDVKPMIPSRLSKVDSASQAGNPFVMCGDCVGCLWKTTSSGELECRDTTSYEGANEASCRKNNGLWCTGQEEALAFAPAPPPDPLAHRQGPGGRVEVPEEPFVPDFPFEIVELAPTTTMQAPPPSPIVASDGCGLDMQAPIDLDPAVLGDIRYPEERFGPLSNNSMRLPLTFYESNDHAVMFNDGNALRVNLKRGNFGSLNFNRSLYQVQELGFFFPSEHKVSGSGSAGELQITLRNSDDQEAIISVFIQEEDGDADDVDIFFDKFRHSTVSPGAEMLCYTPINIGLLGKQLSGKYWNYQSSDLTPPCVPVERFVMARPAKVDKAVLDDFRAVYAANARPVQPLADRVVSGPRDFAPASTGDAPAEGIWR